jgi:hypothetical protein
VNLARPAPLRSRLDPEMTTDIIRASRHAAVCSRASIPPVKIEGGAVFALAAAVAAAAVVTQASAVHTDTGTGADRYEQ